LLNLFSRCAIYFCANISGNTAKSATSQLKAESVSGSALVALSF
jgi:hypothetical protein